MSAPAGAPGSDLVSPPRRTLSRARLLLLVGALLAWSLPWVEALPQGANLPRTETGAQRTGSAGALAWIACWGLAAAALSRTRRGLCAGEAATSAAIAAAVTALCVLRHPWLPGGERREAWVPIFAPLGILALMDLVVDARPGGAGREIAVIRAFAALVAASAFWATGLWAPLWIALWLGVLPLALRLPRDGRGVRRALEGALAVAAAALALSPEAQAPLAAPAIGVPGPASLAFRAAAGLVAILSLVALLRPEGRPALGPSR